MVETEAADQIDAVCFLGEQVDDRRSGYCVDMRVASRGPGRAFSRDERARQLIVHKLIFEQRGKHFREVEARTQREIPAPRNVWGVVANRGVESTTGLERQAVKHPMMAPASAALAVLARGSPIRRWTAKIRAAG